MKPAVNPEQNAVRTMAFAMSLLLAATLLLVAKPAFSVEGDATVQLPDLPLPAEVSNPNLPMEPLGLTFGDASGRPGSVIAVALRTYASRGVGQGQICFRFSAARSVNEELGGPVSSFIGGEVFSPAGDVLERAFAAGSPAAPQFLTQFIAPDNEVNSIDGPLAVLYFRLDDNLFPGQEFQIRPDIADNWLTEADGTPVPLEIRPGTLKILGPGDQFELSAAAEATEPGRVAILSMQTSELRLLSGGQVGLRYDPAIATGPPTVRIDPRYGNAEFDTSGSIPEAGLIVVSFTSPDHTLNKIPGDIVQILVPTRADIPTGFQTTITLVPSLTHVFDALGNAMPLEYDFDVLEFL